MLTDFHGDEERKKNSKEKFKMADSKKTVLFNSASSQYFFGKISGIGPWVSICKLMQGAVAQSIWSSHCTVRHKVNTIV